MKFLGGFVVGLIFASLFGLSGCAHQNSKIGECTIPPSEQDGYKLVSCSAAPDDFKHLVCYYVRAQDFGLEVRQVESVDCGGYEITGQGIIAK